MRCRSANKLARLDFDSEGGDHEHQPANKKCDGCGDRNLERFRLVEGGLDRTKFRHPLLFAVLEGWMHHGDYAQKKKNEAQDER